MAINTVGFDNADITEAGFAKLMRAVGEVGYKHGVLSGLTVAPGAGTRQVSVAAGVGYGPGLWFENTASVTLTLAANAGSSNRVDYVVARIDWSANTATPAVVQGSSPSAPALSETEGGVWEVPLARVTVRPGVTTLAAGDVVVCKPLPRVVDKCIGSPFPEVTRGYSAAAYTISTLTVRDPGWPYRLDVDASVKFAQTNSGYGYLRIVVDGTTVETARSPRLTEGGAIPTAVRTITDVMTGPCVVQARIEPVFMQTGSSLSLVNGTSAWFRALQIPA